MYWYYSLYNMCCVTLFGWLHTWFECFRKVRACYTAFSGLWFSPKPHLLYKFNVETEYVHVIIIVTQLSNKFNHRKQKSFCRPSSIKCIIICRYTYFQRGIYLMKHCWSWNVVCWISLNIACIYVKGKERIFTKVSAIWFNQFDLKFYVSISTVYYCFLLWFSLGFLFLTPECSWSESTKCVLIIMWK